MRHSQFTKDAVDTKRRRRKYKLATSELEIRRSIISELEIRNWTMD